jgi:hypothetical protein
VLTIEDGNIDPRCSFVLELDLLCVAEIKCLVQEQLETLKIAGKL